jgi:hypothetical protein
MQVKDSDTICNEISDHISKQGSSRSSWYVGIASNVKQRLHGDHNVPEKNYWFIWRKAESSSHARAIEKAFLDWGCDGGSGGGDSQTTFVYAYLKSGSTRE